MCLDLVRDAEIVLQGPLHVQRLLLLLAYVILEKNIFDS